MKTFLVIVLGFLVSSSVIAQEANSNVVKSDHYHTKDFDCVIFPGSYEVGLAKKVKAYSPTRADVDKAEVALKSQLAEINVEKILQRSPFIIDENLDQYRRQYFGYIDKRGDTILYINCFWHGSKVPENDAWLKCMREVLDGGSAFWNVKYNMRTGKLFDLSVNGVA